MSLILLYLATGLLAGLLAGLFGIGGGLIIVPLLLISFRIQGLQEAVSTHLAIGTSLASIVITGISSVRAHLREVPLNWPLVIQLTLGMVLGAQLGGDLASGLSGELLRRLMGAFAGLVALTLWFDWHPAGSKAARVQPLEHGLVGFAIGTLSALFGIGGGTATVPYLRWRGEPLVQAIASSAACGVPITLSAALSYLYHGWQQPELPPHAIGFIYWPALLAIILTSAVTVRLGAHLAHQLPALWLRRVFALLQLVIAGKFLLF